MNPILEELGRQHRDAEHLRPASDPRRLVGGPEFEPGPHPLAVHLDHDANGYLLTDASMQTSLEGVWAVGDVRAQLTRQISTAVGDGTTAAVAASAYVERWRDQRRRAAGGRSRAEQATSPAA